ETEGPYFVDENLNRSDLTAGTSRASVVNGLPLALQLKVYQVSGSAVTPVSGAHVDIWHADALGVYSDEAVQSTYGETWLRGFQEPAEPKHDQCHRYGLQHVRHERRRRGIATTAHTDTGEQRKWIRRNVLDRIADTLSDRFPKG